ncbi:IclR family transcriptional regulator [Gulosibacter molinativorax]|uniref:IclR family transcriptional regulator n=1 Tax=Gulosibacter molinativorax TaxID=256821 RepID=A0ABT7C668_9MICO|nr:IclR family transcriptional regulator [Gulosibacter molinativorax]MDJ1370530.1 IclR family transcriptional regulator [Gulosibacter molinativorax]QUY62057.1 Putative iclR family transcriptional regulator [Gulosibacter molinativorax]
MKQPIRTLANSDDIIALLAHEGDLSPAQIAEQLDLPRPTVYRLLDGLSSIDFTEPVRDSKTRLSLRWLRMADAAREAMREWRGADQVLTDLVERTGQTAYITVPRDGEAVCVAWEQGNTIGVVETKPGRSLSMHAGAAGRVVLAYGTDLEGYLESNPKRQRFNDRTLLTDDELRADVELTRQRGYAISEGDITDGITAIAVPVRGSKGKIAGSLTVSGLDEHFAGREDAILEVLQDAAARLGNLAQVSN